jgi:hypothetical protein
MNHIEIETLINKFEGRIAASDENEIAVHMTKCGECRVIAAKLADFFAYAGPHTANDVPQAVTARILNIYQRKPAVAREPEKSRSSIVSLIFDDWQMALNERYSGMDTRQMLYRSGNFEIDLRIELVGDMCRLTGQIFPEMAGATAEIFSSSQPATAAFNDCGEFVFDPVPQGVYDVRISAGSEEIHIEKVPLQQ